MSDRTSEPRLQDRLEERPSIKPQKLREVRPRDLLIRFLAGGLTSVGAGVVTLAFGARTGGIFLAFPAILAASLTLIEEKEDAVHAREDARGAIVGGLALALFALVAALTFGHVAGAVALLLAACAWALAAFALYALLWGR